MLLRSLARKTLDDAKEHFASFRASLTLNEISGAFGDIGTFLPLLVGGVLAYLFLLSIFWAATLHPIS